MKQSEIIYKKIQEHEKALLDLRTEYQEALLAEALEASEFQPGDPIEYYRAGWCKGVFGGYKIHYYRARAFVHPLKKDGTPSAQMMLYFDNIRKRSS